MNTSKRQPQVGLLVTTAIGAALYANVAFAQAAGRGENAAAADQNQLEEVVVTATRQADTVNRVPLAVTAQTQRALDQQGVRTVRDLENLVPSLNTTQSLASGASQFSIRGVGFLGNGQAGAAPVGFYLDDTPLQKRNVGGGVATSNGTPLPPLFDLDRVEVLRGPQGTLFGGGSEGGTIRYIQPAPSLTRYSEYARAQVSQAKGGDTSYEGGVAVGGPIIQDKLGFRASVFARNQGGFIDLIDPLTKKEWRHNSGGQDKIRMMRAALAWAPSENSRVTFDYFSSVDKSKDITTTHGLDVPNTIFVPTTCYNANNTPVSNGTAFNAATGTGFQQTSQGFAGVNNAARVGPIGNLSSTPVARARSNPSPVAWGDAACAQRRAAGDVTYTLPGFTYGPYALGKDDRVDIDTAPSKTNLQIASLTLDYDFGGKMSVKSITSYIDDQTKTVTQQTGPIQTGINTGLAYNDPQFGLRFSPTSGPSWNPIWGPSATRVDGHFVSNNRRYGITQEVRFSSGGENQRFSWVGGVYYSNIRGKAMYDNYQPLDFWAATTFGLTEQQRFAVSGLETSPGLFNNYDSKRQSLKDVEIAGFAEGNFWIIPEKLKATAGIRISRVSFEYAQSFTGPVTSVGPGGGTSVSGVSFASPSPQNGGTNSGSTAESPVTPKFGLQYNLTDRDLVYVSAAKGFRAGGVNSQVSYGICQQALDQIGYLPADLPQTYKSDSVWSYELGGKFRLLSNRVQFNAAVYQIDWNDAQYTTNPGSCGLVTTFNVPKARSRGVELEATARVFRGLTVNAAYGYTNAKYTQSLIFPAGRQALGGPIPTPFTVVVSGQKIPVPPHTVSLGGRYDVEIAPSMRAYLRADYRFSSSFPVSPFPTAAYTPDQFNQKVQSTNLRLGVEYGDFDINVFVNNLFDRDNGVLGGGRTQCLPAAAGGTADCNTFNAYNPLRTLNSGTPREFGLQIAYRH